MEFISAILRPNTGDFSNTYLFSQIHSISFPLAFSKFLISKEDPCQGFLSPAARYDTASRIKKNFWAPVPS